MPKQPKKTWIGPNNLTNDKQFIKIYTMNPKSTYDIINYRRDGGFDSPKLIAATVPPGRHLGQQPLLWPQEIHGGFARRASISIENRHSRSIIRRILTCYVEVLRTMFIYFSRCLLIWMPHGQKNKTNAIATGRHVNPRGVASAHKVSSLEICLRNRSK